MIHTHIIARLEGVLDEIEQQIAAVRDDAARFNAELGTDLSPYAMKDTNGRPILVDLLTAKATALAALARYED